MKKALIAIVIGLCAVAPVIATGAEEAASAAAVDVAPAGQFPIVSETVTYDLLVGYSVTSQSPNFEENPFTIWYEDLTNVRFEFDATASGQLDEKRNLVLASGDYPDVMINMALSIPQAYQLGAQGVIADLGPAIDQYSINLKNVFADEPWVEEQMTSPDGGQFFLPWINSGCFHCEYSQRAYIYRPWLDELGLDTPTTTEELRDVLAAFVANDLNGNGENDELGLMGAANGWRTEPWAFLMNSFVYTNPGSSPFMRMNDGEAEFVANTTGWRDGLRYLNSLYEDGLIAPESFVQSNSQMKVFGENPEGPMVGMFVGGHYGIFTDLSQQDGRWTEYEALAPLEGPDGFRTSPHFPHQVGAHLVVFNQVEQPEIMVRWADWFFTFEGFMRGVKGYTEGEHYRMIPESDGIPNMTGTDVAFFEVFDDAVDRIADGISLGWENSTVRYWNRRSFEGVPQAENGGQGPVLIRAADVNSQFDVGQAMPVVIFPPEVASEIGEIQATLTESVKSFLARFVVGELDIDDDWASYLRELNNIGVDRYVELFNLYLP